MIGWKGAGFPNNKQIKKNIHLPASLYKSWEISAAGSSTAIGGGSVAVKLPEDVECRDESDETETHHQHHRRRHLETGRFVRVEPQHVAPSSAETPSRSAACGGSPPPHPCSGSRSPPRAYGARAGGLGGRWRLRLRASLRHCSRDARKRDRGRDGYLQEERGPNQESDNPLTAPGPDRVRVNSVSAEANWDS